jgi:hypothetical protein
LHESRRFILSQNISLKELERKAWTSHFQDGLWDVFLGLLLVSSAVNAWLSDTGVPSSTRIPIYIGIMVLGGLVMWAGKRFITLPRMGRVKFGPKRKAKLNWLRVVLFLSVLVIAALFLAGLGVKNHWLQRPEWWLMGRTSIASAIVTLNFLVVFSVMAYFMEFTRLYLYGVLFALQEVVGVGLRELADVNIGFFIGSAVSAVIVLLIGTVVFVRFLREYPLPAVGVSDGNG